MKKILVTGAKGMLAHDLIPVLDAQYTLKLTDIDEMDITDFDSVSQVFNDFSPDVIINCAAYTAVDKAEDEGMVLNYKINTLGVGILAKACSKYDSELIHISTDYVFDGTNSKGYLPKDSPKPLNEYGKAKRLGEELARQHYPDTIVVRTAWLYGGGKEFPNFVNTMLKLGGEKESLQVVDDQHGLPTYTVDLATAIEKIIQEINSNRGLTFHFTNSGETSISWADFAAEIMRVNGLACSIESCGSEMYQRPAPRPKWSELKNESDVTLPDWKDGLQRYLERK